MQSDTLPDLLSLLPPPFEWLPIESRDTEIKIGKWQNFQYAIEQIKNVAPDKSFFIAKYPITNLQYNVFLEADDGYANVQNWDFSPAALEAREANPVPADIPRDNDRPAVWASYFDALAFCQWLNRKLKVASYFISLPTESQWQIAAQGKTERLYPWGNDFNPEFANTRESGIVKTTPVSNYPQGISPYGVMGMSGNVWEWCKSASQSSPEDIAVLRGGSWRFDGQYATTTYRYFFPPDEGHGNIGFRIVCQTG
jgi:formylglycine-generating enzyme required for sulfatase activity